VVIAVASLPDAGPEVDEADGLDAAELDLVEGLEVGGLLVDLAVDGGEAVPAGVFVGLALAALGVVGDLEEGELLLELGALGEEQALELAALELAAGVEALAGVLGGFLAAGAEGGPEGGEVAAGAGEQGAEAAGRRERGVTLGGEVGGEHGGELADVALLEGFEGAVGGVTAEADDVLDELVVEADGAAAEERDAGEGDGVGVAVVVVLDEGEALEMVGGEAERGEDVEQAADEGVVEVEVDPRRGHLRRRVEDDGLGVGGAAPIPEGLAALAGATEGVEGALPAGREGRELIGLDAAVAGDRGEGRGAEQGEGDVEGAVEQARVEAELLDGVGVAGAGAADLGVEALVGVALGGVELALDDALASGGGGGGFEGGGGGRAERRSSRARAGWCRSCGRGSRARGPRRGPRR
jgi:hypothetical protein